MHQPGEYTDKRLMNDFTEFKLEIFIPGEYLEKLRDVITQAGAGRVGNYDCCMSVMPVRGFWRPLEGANPYQGKIGEVESAEEVKVEINCRRAYLPEVLRLIREVHPYEEPLINIVPLMNQHFAEDNGDIRYGP